MTTRYKHPINPNISYQVGQRIREKRERKGWSQEQLAAYAGMRQANMSALELGQRMITLVTLERIAGALDTTPVDLLK